MYDYKRIVAILSVVCECLGEHTVGLAGERLCVFAVC